MVHRTLPIYTPVCICNRYESYEYAILSKPLLVDDRTHNMDCDSVRGDIDDDGHGDVLDEYWNYPLPLIVSSHFGPDTIISRHGQDIKLQTEEAIRSLVKPSLYEIIIIEQIYGKKDTFCIKRVAEGDPVIYIPDVLVDRDDHTMIDYHVKEAIFKRKDEVSGAYAILKYDDYIIHRTSPGIMKLYIHKIESTVSLRYNPSITISEYLKAKKLLIEKPEVRYTLSTEVSEYPIYLYTNELEFKISDSREELYKQLQSYRVILFSRLPIHLSDIDICSSCI